MLDNEKLDKVMRRFEAVQSEMSSTVGPDQFVRLSKEYAELSPVADAVQRFSAVRKEAEGLRAIIDDPESDREMRG
jgi:peptide chain release factor 1